MSDIDNRDEYPEGFAIGTPRTEEERRAAKSFGASCGHIKRRLSRGEPLKGKLLELALELAHTDEVARKLEAGEALSEYEYHVLVEGTLLHARLSQ